MGIGHVDFGSGGVVAGLLVLPAGVIRVAAGRQGRLIGMCWGGFAGAPG
jgi:hypothetical protein